MTAIRRRCQCHAVIEAAPDPASIELAVRVHAEQPEHRAAWTLAELRRELTPTYGEVRAELVTLRRVG